MGALSAFETSVLLLSLGLLLLAARGLGELFKRFHQPALLGELLAGIILGPTVAGRIAPRLQGMLFPSSGSIPCIVEGIDMLAIVLFLLVAGMEVEISELLKEGRSALRCGFLSFFLPFAIVTAVLQLLPPALIGAPAPGEPERAGFILLLALVLSISALSIAARILLDLDLYRTRLGSIAISAAIFNDLLGWLAFAAISVLLPMEGHSASPLTTLLWVFAATIVLLTVVRRLFDAAVPWLQAHTSWPGGIIGVCLALTLLCAALFEHLGVHALYGAFLAGIVIGDSWHMRESTKYVISTFVSFFFAPIFFASIGLRMDLATLDPYAAAVLLLLACGAKLVGGMAGASAAGLKGEEMLTAAIILNSRGGMELILALIALEQGIFQPGLLAAIIVTALASTMIGGEALRRLLPDREGTRLTGLLAGERFAVLSPSADRRSNFRRLCELAGASGNLPADEIFEAVESRERMVPTVLTDGLAVPHARLEGLSAPIVCAGVCPEGFDYGNGRKIRIVLLILTPKSNPDLQAAILADAAKVLGKKECLQRAASARNFTEFLAQLKAGV